MNNNTNDISILYVEDDPEIQDKMLFFLEDETDQIYQAYDGKEALEIYKEKRPDIIITDINMPHFDGLNFAREVKDIDEEQAIIVISGLDDKTNLLQSIEIGIDSFLPKPLNVELLVSKISQIREKIVIKREHEKKIEEKNSEIYRMAHFDNLTNTYNRYFFDTSLKDAISRLQAGEIHLALFFIDLDNFKTINDTYGHAIGDVVLKKLVNNIQTVIRKDDILARIGGDEFALIVENFKNANDIETLAKKISKLSNFAIDLQDYLEDTNGIEIKGLVHSSCSIGVCVTKDKSISKKELLHNADTAMYAAKKAGKATYKICTRAEELL